MAPKPDREMGIEIDICLSSRAIARLQAIDKVGHCIRIKAGRRHPWHCRRTRHPITERMAVVNGVGRLRRGNQPEGHSQDREKCGAPKNDAIPFSHCRRITNAFGGVHDLTGGRSVIAFRRWAGARAEEAGTFTKCDLRLTNCGRGMVRVSLGVPSSAPPMLPTSLGSHGSRVGGGVPPCAALCRLRNGSAGRWRNMIFRGLSPFFT